MLQIKETENDNFFSPFDIKYMDLYTWTRVHIHIMYAWLEIQSLWYESKKINKLII